MEAYTNGGSPDINTSILRAATIVNKPPGELAALKFNPSQLANVDSAIKNMDTYKIMGVRIPLISSDAVVSNTMREEVRAVAQQNVYAGMPEQQAIDEAITNVGKQYTQVNGYLVNTKDFPDKDKAAAAMTAIIKDKVAMNSSGPNDPHGVVSDYEPRLVNGTYQLVNKLGVPMVNEHGPVTVSPDDINGWNSKQVAIQMQDAIEKSQGKYTTWQLFTNGAFDLQYRDQFFTMKKAWDDRQAAIKFSDAQHVEREGGSNHNQIWNDLTAKAQHQAGYVTVAPGVSPMADVQSHSAILGLLHKAEVGTGGQGYNTISDYNKATPPKVAVSEMTLGEVSAYQKSMIDAGSASTAIGGYQFKMSTLNEAKAALGLKDDTKFSQAVQDQLALYLLRKRGLDDPKMSNEDFITSVSKEWAGLPGLDGQSHYSGDGLNAATVKLSELQSVLGSRNVAPTKTTSGISTDTGVPGLVPSDHATHHVDLSSLTQSSKDKLSGLAKEWGSNLVISSGYRDKSTNAAVGGAGKSEHMNHDAVDIEVGNWGVQKRVQFLRMAVKAGFTGIGVYNGHIHLDSRQGQKAWGTDHSYRTIPPWARETLMGYYPA